MREICTQGVWAKIAWVWDFPPVKSLRITITAAQWGMHLPTLLALIATQWSVIFAHVGIHSPQIHDPSTFDETLSEMAPTSYMQDLQPFSTFDKTFL